MKQLGPEQVCHRFSAEDPPGLRVESGEVFSVRTTDRFRNVSKTDPDFAKSDVVRSMNGPIYVNGVRAGDTLKVEFLSMSPAETSAYVLALPGHGALGSRIPNFLMETVDVTGQDAVFPNGTSVPIRPMLGLIGVAPEQGEAGLGATGPFGGQLSITDVTAGSTLYLPVFHDGAFLSMGDSHLAMGEGEATSSAVEGSMSITLRASASQDVKVSGPMVVTSEHVISFGRGVTMEEAANTATLAMADLLMSRLNISATERRHAYRLWSRPADRSSPSFPLQHEDAHAPLHPTPLTSRPLPIRIKLGAAELSRPQPFSFIFS